MVLSPGKTAGTKEQSMRKRETVAGEAQQRPTEDVILKENNVSDLPELRIHNKNVWYPRQAG
jgi:hypothetical protein